MMGVFLRITTVWLQCFWRDMIGVIPQEEEDVRPLCESEHHEEEHDDDSEDDNQHSFAG